VDLGIGFEDTLTGEALQELESTLVKLLLEDGFTSEEDSEPDEGGSSSFAYERKSDDGEVLELIHVHGDYVHATLFEYRGWDITRDNLVERLGLFFEQARSGASKVSGVSLAFRDIFISESPDAYSAAEVFKQSEFLPSVIFQGGPEWGTQLRLMVGGSSQLSSWSPVHSRLSVSAGIRDAEDEPKEHVTSLFHHQIASLKDSSHASNAMSESELKACLDDMHNRNRDLMLQLLSDEMCAAIGLEKENDE
jgi:hypothetical protein